MIIDKTIRSLVGIFSRTLRKILQNPGHMTNWWAKKKLSPMWAHSSE